VPTSIFKRICSEYGYIEHKWNPLISVWKYRIDACILYLAPQGSYTDKPSNNGGQSPRNQKKSKTEQFDYCLGRRARSRDTLTCLVPWKILKIPQILPPKWFSAYLKCCTVIPSTGITVTANRRRHVHNVTSVATPVGLRRRCYNADGNLLLILTNQCSPSSLVWTGVEPNGISKEQNLGWKSGGNQLLLPETWKPESRPFPPPTQMLYQALIPFLLAISAPMPQCQPSCSSSWALNFSQIARELSHIRNINWMCWL
jgi:hypothetical protein